MWKYISRNVREPLERRICSVSDAPGKDVNSVCKIQTKFIPLLTNLCGKYPPPQNEEKCASDAEKRKQKTRRGCWRSDSYIGHAWIGAISWSAALALSWNFLRPLYHIRLTWEKDSKCPWKHHHITVQKNVELNSETGNSIIPHVRRCTISPLNDEKPQTFHFNNIQAQKYDTPYSSTWSVLSKTLLTQTNCVVPAQKKIYGNSSALKDTNNVTYGPPTAEEALNEAADNFEKVHHNVMGEIHNQLGVAVIHTGEHSQALHYFLRAAHAHKHPAAAYNLGICYEKGIGTEKDMKRAASYYEIASQRGHPTAMYNLGIYYIHGWGGIPVDINKAHDLFKQAASLGQGDAIKALQSVPEEVHSPFNVVQQALGLLEKLVLQPKDVSQKLPHIETSSTDCKDISELLQESVLKYTPVQIK